MDTGIKTATRANSGMLIWPADLTASNNRLVRRGYQATIAPRSVIGTGASDEVARAAILQRCPHSHKTIDAAKACGHKLWKALPADAEQAKG